jgi:hypothetical protein
LGGRLQSTIGRFEGAVSEYAARLDWRGDAVVGGLVALASGVVFLLMRQEPVFSDDLTYFERAGRLLDGDPPSGSANAHRYGLIVTVAVARAVFGAGPVAFYVVPLLTAIGIPLSVYLLGRVFLPRWVAASAAVVVLTQPIFLDGVSLLLPDWFGVVWLVTGIAASIVAVRAGSLSPRRRTELAVLGGVALYFALWVRESLVPVLLVVPIVLWCLDLDARWRRTLFAGVGALAACLTAEAVFSWVAFGDPLARVDAMFDSHLRFVPRGLGGETWTWGDLLTRYGWVLAETAAGTVLLLGFLGASIAVVVMRDRRLILLGALSLFAWASVSLTVGSLDPLSPLLRTKDRYLSAALAFVPLFVLGAAWVGIQRTRPDRGAVRTGLVLAVIGFTVVSAVTGVAASMDDSRLVRNGADMLSSTDLALSALGEEGDPPLGRVYTDRRTLKGVALFSPEVSVQSLDDAAGLVFDPRMPEAFTAGDVVLLNLRRLQENADNYWDQPLPEWLESPPAHWMLLDESPAQGMGLWYVVDRARVDGGTTDETASFTVEVDGEAVPVASDGLVTVSGRVDLETRSIRPIPAGTDLVVVVVEVEVVSGDVDAGRSLVVLHDAAGEVIAERRLRVVSSSSGIELTAGIPVYSGVEFDGYSASIRLRGDGVAALHIGVAALDVGFDGLHLDWPPWGRR